MVDPFSLWTMFSTVSMTYFHTWSLRSAFCSQCRSAPHRLSLVLSQYLHNQSVGSCICSVMPVSSIFRSSFFTFCKRGTGTPLAVYRLYGWLSSLSLIFTGAHFTGFSSNSLKIVSSGFLTVSTRRMSLILAAASLLRRHSVAELTT